MNPVAFPEANVRLTAPRGNPRVQPLMVWTDGEVVVSAWRPTMRERLALIFGRPVWLWVLAGRTQPPVALSVAKPFGEQRKAA